MSPYIRNKLLSGCLVKAFPVCITHCDPDLGRAYLLTHALRLCPVACLPGPAPLDSVAYAGLAFVAGCDRELHCVSVVEWLERASEQVHPPFLLA